LSVNHLVRLINSLMIARVELKSAIIPQLPFELVAAEHCSDAAASAEQLTTKNQIPRKAPTTNDQIPKTPAPETPPAIVEASTKPVIARSEPERATRQSPEQSAKAESEPAVVATSRNPVQPPATSHNLPQPPATSSIPLETLALRWDELCAAVQDENPSLPFLLRVARPLRFEDGFLVIGVQYKLHADKLNQAKNVDSVRRGLTALYNGVNIPVRAEIVAADGATPAMSPLTNNLLQQFGGSVVE
jgi:hypothetical protein